MLRSAKSAIPAANPSPTTTNWVVSSLFCARAGPLTNAASASRTGNPVFIIEVLSRMVYSWMFSSLGAAVRNRIRQGNGESIRNKRIHFGGECDGGSVRGLDLHTAL